MEIPYFDLPNELGNRLQEIENRDASVFERCTLKISVCQRVAQAMRADYLGSEPLSIEKQIQFFKTVKPKVFNELKLNLAIMDYLKMLPIGSKEEKMKFIKTRSEYASSFLAKHSEFNTYMRMKADHFDEIYFTKKDYCPIIHSSFEYPTDPEFSSPADPTLSCLMATERFQKFLEFEMADLENTKLVSSGESLKPQMWTGPKAQLVQLLYALDSHPHSKSDLKGLAEWMGRMYNVELREIYRTFQDIKLKKNPTSFLDELKYELIHRIREENGEN